MAHRTLLSGAVTAWLGLYAAGAWAAAPVTKPLAALPPSDAGAELVFNEEFRTLRANPAGIEGWTTTLDHGNRTLASNDEQEFYSDATVGDMPFAIVDGQLVITAAPCKIANPLPYCSGALTSRTLFFQRYGYFEMRARLPRGRGLWPAFWLLPKGGGWPPELDVMEVLGHDPATLYASVHWTSQRHEFIAHKVHTADLSEAFHLYGLSWHPDLLRWFVNGVEVAQTPTPPGLDKPMYLLVNLAVGGPKSWPGAPIATTVFPARMTIDYIRAYRYDDRPAPPYAAPAR